MSESGPGRNLRRELLLLLVMVGALGVTSGIFETTLNNFLSDTFHLTAKQRGALEFPRELPGFLVAALGGALFFLSEIRLGMLAATCIALGLGGLALLGDRSYGTMILFLVIWSTGSHLMIPIGSTLALSLAPRGKRAGRMGQVGSVGMMTTILGSGLVWLGGRYAHLSYPTLFVVAGACALLAAAALSRMHPLPFRPGQRPKLVFKRRYRLYYLLCTLAGARKQVFITFGPWVLIKVFGEPFSTIAMLWVIASVIGIFFQPQLGRLIDRLGERTILRADAVVLILVCLGYGFAARLPLPPDQRVYVVYACYVLDLTIFACSMARATYLDKIAETESDVHASLSLGVSIDHAVSMSIPTLGGMLWGAVGYPAVFVAAACLAVCNFAAASFIRVPRREERPREAEAERELAGAD
jgi:predicted MFS family arabinose efflux permease